MKLRAMTMTYLDGLPYTIQLSQLLIIIINTNYYYYSHKNRVF